MDRASVETTSVRQNQHPKSVATGDPFLTTEEAANHLSLSVKTLEAWRLQRYGPAYAKFGRSVRYRLSAIEIYILTTSKTSNSEGVL